MYIFIWPPLLTASTTPICLSIRNAPMKGSSAYCGAVLPQLGTYDLNKNVLWYLKWINLKNIYNRMFLKALQLKSIIWIRDSIIFIKLCKEKRDKVLKKFR